MTVGVLGAGRMGLPVLRRFLAAGHRVTASDPDLERAGAARAAGADVGGAREVALGADVLVTVLPGAAEVRDVAEVLAALRPGSVWLDLTSGDPRTTDDLAARLHRAGVGAVGAAMGGGPAGAAAGSLDLFVGGADADVERVLPLLVELSRGGGSIRRAGGSPGAGQLVKLLANLLWFGQSVAVTESLLLARDAGLDVGAVRDALAGSAGDSAFLQRHVDSLLRGDHLRDFGLDRCVEELEVLDGLAAEHGTPFGLAREVTRLHREALARFGPVDGELLAAALLEERSGRPLSEVRPRPGG
ncbi:3-hydroxyisobutyrate dehydrogenase-like beta-hydroxyacid dehydrogenase [Kineococcus radiotolerans]|uniref:3-hydroxyisobutyrate dehydrogenase-like beta-hydroxyacid dehydrogenase n=1 Tax=Kineococcus radiotolerans TaxID=131568 RepID=A0A7W4TMK9_KINRA|nr:NAD(P)-binding domain-containing protein [Kineococcus radiotolerans]MBB2901731.1 3-hydroxyisobutyrate dehydrogenase-like beta-hydroxyacid dehydrogenase [Kineococcus radiotolerans]